MKNLLINLSFVITLLIFGYLCNTSSTSGVTKSITGRAGELVVVISKESWASEPGKKIRELLAQPQIALPQDEPLFDLIDVPREAFKDIFKTTRNILLTEISSTVKESTVIFKNDVWAHPQATVEIKAKNKEEFEKVLTENSDKIIAYFLKIEKKRLSDTYRKIHEKTLLKKLQEKGISMYALPGFKLATEGEDFLWFRYETPDISQGIFVYWFDYVSDSTFTTDYLLGKRNVLLRKYVPGPTDGSYMTTEMRIEQLLNVFEHNGNYAAEMRGLWRVENDFMGGPYVLIAELDASQQRVVVADGYVYAPGKDKRNLLRQVEAMIYSMEFEGQQKNDKINSQVKMGN